MGWWKEATFLVAALGAVMFLATRTTTSPPSTTSYANMIGQTTSSSQVDGGPIAVATSSAGRQAVEPWTHGIALTVNRQVQGVTAKVSAPVGSAFAPRATPTSIPPVAPATSIFPVAAATSIFPVAASTSTIPVAPAPPAPAIQAPLTDSVTFPAPAATVLGPGVPDDVRRWESFIEKYAAEDGLDPNLVAAVMMTESGGNPTATSSKGAIGLMQVVNGSYDPESSIRDGTRILASDLYRYGGDMELSLAAYNAGSGAVAQFGGIPPYHETETYVFVVLNRYYLYSAT